MWQGNPWSFLLIGCDSTDSQYKENQEKKTKIDEFQNSLASNMQSLQEVDNWYNDYILPQRTVAEGNSWQTLDDMISGKWNNSNNPNPNGLCGDTSLFINQEYKKFFPNQVTAEGLTLGTVVWEEDALTEITRQNHAAIIMMPANISSLLIFRYDYSNKELISHENNRISGDAALTWRVYDLFYKKEPMSLLEWWKLRDDKLGGKITLGKYLY